MKVTINPYLARTVEVSGYDLPKLQNAIDSAYNDKTVVVKREEGITSTKVAEKKGTFTANEAETRKREGKVSSPLRFVNLSKGLDKFHKTYGEPSEELTIAIVPVSLKDWLDEKFSLTAKPEEKPEGNGKGKRNGGIEKVPAPAVPA